MRHLGVVTSARSDFSLLLPLLSSIEEADDLLLTLFATGMHFSARHGTTINEVRNAGLSAEIVSVFAPCASDTPAAAADAVGRAVSAFGEAFQSRRPDLLIVLGDRFDMLAAPLAALLFNLPVAHIAGGELTHGSVFDDSIRHAVTKLSHLHFATHEEFARRLLQLGEEPWRVMVSGSPGLDALSDFEFQSRDALFEELHLNPDRQVTSFTYHPETLFHEGSGAAIQVILAAADAIDSQIVFTLPNADLGSSAIITAIEAYCDRHPDHVVHASLGRDRYWNLLHHADCLVGNSSSGIWEAASFELPVVNIGGRQSGRIAPRNVIQTDLSTAAVQRAWERALDPAFRQTLRGLVNPYGDGHASRRILARLASIPLDGLINKRFCDLPSVDSP